MTVTPFSSESKSDAVVDPSKGESTQPPPPVNNHGSPNKSKFLLPIILASVFVCSCVLIGVAVTIFQRIVSNSTPTPTQTLTDTPTWTDTFTPKPIYTITPLPSFTFTPQPSSTSTFTPSPIVTETSTFLPSDTLHPSITSTATLGFTRTPTRIKAVCPCSHDLYDCKDFSTHEKAQNCYDYCVSTGWGDVHGLDKSGSGIVCKGLP